MKERFWDYVHAYAPCRVLHLLCSGCRKEGICPNCWERRIESWGGYPMSPEARAREEAETGMTIGLWSPPTNSTFATSTTFTMTFPKES